jgi:Helitron helicase-like domain at N-terminus
MHFPFSSSCLRGVRQSPAYLEVQEKKIMAMIRQLVCPSLFITLSAAETKWTELLCNLEKILHNNVINEEAAANLSFQEKANLIRSDPITCARNFDHRYRSLFNYLFKKPGGIFSPHIVTDFFQRIENQLRGSVHSHGIYWVEGILRVTIY